MSNLQEYFLDIVINKAAENFQAITTDRYVDDFPKGSSSSEVKKMDDERTHPTDKLMARLLAYSLMLISSWKLL